VPSLAGQLVEQELAGARVGRVELDEPLRVLDGARRVVQRVAVEIGGARPEESLAVGVGARAELALERAHEIGRAVALLEEPREALPRLRAPGREHERALEARNRPVAVAQAVAPERGDPLEDLDLLDGCRAVERGLEPGAERVERAGPLEERAEPPLGVRGGGGLRCGDVLVRVPRVRGAIGFLEELRALELQLGRARPLGARGGALAEEVGEPFALAALAERRLEPVERALAVLVGEPPGERGAVEADRFGGARETLAHEIGAAQLEAGHGRGIVGQGLALGREERGEILVARRRLEEALVERHLLGHRSELGGDPLHHRERVVRLPERLEHLRADGEAVAALVARDERGEPAVRVGELGEIAAAFEDPEERAERGEVLGVGFERGAVRRRGPLGVAELLVELGDPAPVAGALAARELAVELVERRRELLVVAELLLEARAALEHAAVLGRDLGEALDPEQGLLGLLLALAEPHQLPHEEREPAAIRRHRRLALERFDHRRVVARLERDPLEALERARLARVGRQRRLERGPRGLDVLGLLEEEIAQREIEIDRAAPGAPRARRLEERAQRVEAARLGVEARERVERGRVGRIGLERFLERARRALGIGERAGAESGEALPERDLVGRLGGARRLLLEERRELAHAAAALEQLLERREHLRVRRLALEREAEAVDRAVGVAALAREQGRLDEHRHRKHVGRGERRARQPARLRLAVPGEPLDLGEGEEDHRVVVRGELERAAVPEPRTLRVAQPLELDAARLERDREAARRAGRQVVAALQQLGEERPLLVQRRVVAERLERLLAARILGERGAEELGGARPVVQRTRVEPREIGERGGAVRPARAADDALERGRRLRRLAALGADARDAAQGADVLGIGLERALVLREALRRVVHAPVPDLSHLREERGALEGLHRERRLVLGDLEHEVERVARGVEAAELRQRGAEARRAARRLAVPRDRLVPLEAALLEHLAEAEAEPGGGLGVGLEVGRLEAALVEADELRPLAVEEVVLLQLLEGALIARVRLEALDGPLQVRVQPATPPPHLFRSPALVP
jgi:hypothetical protein